MTTVAVSPRTLSTPQSRSASLSSTNSEDSTTEYEKFPRSYQSKYITPPKVRLVRALYDYTSDEPNSLSFKKGDIISVYMQLETGWWDGKLRDVRGWFPSNYTCPVEADSLSEELACFRFFPDRHRAENNSPAPHTYDVDIDEDGEIEIYNRSIDPLSKARPGLVPVTEIRNHSPASNAYSWRQISPRDSCSSSSFTETQSEILWDDLYANLITRVDLLAEEVQKGNAKLYKSRIDDLIAPISSLLSGTGLFGVSINQTDSDFYQSFQQLMTSLGRLELAVESLMTSDCKPECRSEFDLECERLVLSAKRFINIAQQNKQVPTTNLQAGFISKASSGGSWSGNGLLTPSTLSSSSSKGNLDIWDSIYRKEDAVATTLVPLDEKLLNVAETQRSTITNVIRDLLRFLDQPYSQTSDDEILIEKAMKTVDLIRSFLSALESADLKPLLNPPSPSISDFQAIKQLVYDSSASFIVDAQNVTLLTDSAASAANIEKVKTSVKELDRAVQSIIFTFQFLVEEKNLRESKRSNSVISSSDSDSRRPSAMSDSSYFDSAEVTSMSYTSPKQSNNIKREKKIKQILGTDVPERLAHKSRERESNDTWYLKNEYEKDLVYDAKGNVKGGTLDALMERLTRHDYLDTSFNTTFLLTYRSFTTSRIFLDKLVDRFTIQPPEELSSDEFDIWVEQKQKPIRLRVFNILKIWLEQYWGDSNDEWDEDAQMSRDVLNSLAAFTSHLVHQRFPGASALSKIILRRQHGIVVSKKLLGNINEYIPPPILPRRSMKKLKLKYVDPLELARQLTLIESQLYANIRPMECLNRAWSAKRGSGNSTPGGNDAHNKGSENIKALILYSNQLTNWAAHVVLSQQDLKRRIGVIKHLIAVAQHCRQLNNFSSMTAIISALYSATIHRLHRTWEGLPHRWHATLESLNQLMNSTRNFGEYRAVLHTVNPPCVPFLGVYLTDLTFIEDGNTDMLLKEGDEMINFSKRAKSAEVIREIQQYQVVPYALMPVHELQEIVKAELAAAPAIETLYDMSLSIEPREKNDDDKIARLLQERGFL
ncbi:ras guanine nucleotide exchange factor domain-containing protein [Dipodascopsis uninucleata]